MISGRSAAPPGFPNYKDGRVGYLKRLPPGPEDSRGGDALHRYLPKAPLARLPAALCAFLGLAGALTGPAAVDGRPQMMRAAAVTGALAGAAAGDSVRFDSALVRGPVFAAVDTIRGRILFRGVRFLGAFALDRVVFSGPVLFEDCEFRQGASFLESRFEQAALFRRCSFGKHTSFNKAVLRGADFELSRFSGPATFVDARFEGNASFDHAQFEDVYFDRSRFGACGSFTDAAIALEASFKEAAFGEAVFAGTRFGEETLFRNCRFDGPARFERARFRRRVYFNGADFSRHASFRDITFVRGGVFAGARFAGGASFAGCRFRSDLDLSGATADAQVSLNAAFAGDLILHDSSISTLDLAGYAAVESADSATAASPRVFLEGARFDALRLSWENLQGRIAARDSTRVAPLAEQYAGVAHHLRKRGLDREADAAMAEWTDLLRTSLSWTSPRRWLLELLNATSRYGNSLGRLSATGIGLLLLFTLMYWLGRGRLAADSGAGSAGIGDCFLLSLAAFAHLGRVSRWRASAGIRFLQLLEGVVGWLYWAALVAVGLRLLLRGFV